eukprot:1619916-Pleurochrysis_carterae.AAC.1
MVIRVVYSAVRELLDDEGLEVENDGEVVEDVEGVDKEHANNGGEEAEGEVLRDKPLLDGQDVLAPAIIEHVDDRLHERPVIEHLQRFARGGVEAKHALALRLLRATRQRLPARGKKVMHLQAQTQ